MNFTGFPRNLQDFLFELQFNNSRGKAPEYKDRYKQIMTEPLTRMHADLAGVAMEVDASIEVKPSRCISKMYNDLRYSADTPIKEYVYLRFREATPREENVPGLFFDMGIDAYRFGMCVYRFGTAGMGAIREHVLEHPGDWERALHALDYIQIKGEDYKKDHFPQLPDGPLKSFLNKRSFYAAAERPVNEVVYTPKLVEEVADGFRKAGPLFRLCEQALDEAERKEEQGWR